MISIKSISSRFIKPGLLAFVAAGAALALGLASPAQAASDYLLELDGVKGESKAAMDEFSAKSAELEAAMASLTTQMAAVEALGLDLQRLGGEITLHQEAARQSSTELSWKVEEGERIFSEQIAALLDPAVAQQVLSNFEQLKLSFRDQDDDEDGVATVYEDLTAMLAALGVCRESFDEFSELSSKAIKEWNASTPKLAQTLAK